MGYDYAMLKFSREYSFSGKRVKHNFILLAGPQIPPKSTGNSHARIQDVLRWDEEKKVKKKIDPDYRLQSGST